MGVTTSGGTILQDCQPAAITIQPHLVGPLFARILFARQDGRRYPQALLCLTLWLGVVTVCRTSTW
jgi:hypothetical protein